MYGICNDCGNQEESTSAKCPACKHSWILFPARPKNTESWTKPRGLWDRSRRCYPPNIFYAMMAGLFTYGLIALINVWAFFVEQIHIARWNWPMYIIIFLADIVLIKYAFKTARVSMKYFKRLKLMLFLNLAFSGILFCHTVFFVYGNFYKANSTAYLGLRIVVILFTCGVFLRSRVQRALTRHG
jgi:hypothetical protein